MGINERFKKSHNETDFVAILEGLRHKLGTVNQSTPGRSGGNGSAIGAMVIISCDVEFTKGKGIEKFVFLVTGDKATLFDYSVELPAVLITNSRLNQRLAVGAQ